MDQHEIRGIVKKHLSPLGIKSACFTKNRNPMLIKLSAHKDSTNYEWSDVEERSQRVKILIESELGFSVAFQLDKTKRLARKSNKLTRSEKQALDQAPTGSRTEQARYNRPDDFESWFDKSLPRG